MGDSLAKPLPSAEKQRRHVLVVEDSVAMRYVFAQWLRILEYKVFEAASADEAAAILHSPLKVDVMVTDVHMPGSMNGIALAEYVRKTFPAVKIIIVSGEADGILMDNGAVFFRKPYDLAQVTEQIVKMLTDEESR